jgi:hypothetical protein
MEEGEIIIEMQGEEHGGRVIGQQEPLREGGRHKGKFRNGKSNRIAWQDWGWD